MIVYGGIFSFEKITHPIDCHLSTQRFLPIMVSGIHKNKILGVV